MWHKSAGHKFDVAGALVLLGTLWACTDRFQPLPPLPFHAERGVSKADCVERALISSSDRSGSLTVPGRYCLPQDFRQQSYGGAGHIWPSQGHAILTLYGGDIDIDLRGHSLSANSRSYAISANAGLNAGRASRGQTAFGLTASRVRIHDGYIDLRPLGTSYSIATAPEKSSIISR